MHKSVIRVLMGHFVNRILEFCFVHLHRLIVMLVGITRFCRVANSTMSYLPNRLDAGYQFTIESLSKHLSSAAHALAVLSAAVLFGCATTTKEVSLEPQRLSVVGATFPATEEEFAKGISYGPNGSVPYSEEWKLLWADALLYQYQVLWPLSHGTILYAFESFQTPETIELLLDAALGVSCTPSDLRTKNPRHVAESVANVSVDHPELLDRFAESSRDSMMVLWAVAKVCDHREGLAGSNLLEQCLGYAGLSDLHDQWVARILYRVYRDKVPAEIYRTTSDGVRKYYETGRYH